MDRNKFNNSENNIYYGRQDYEEDDDAYRPYNISPANINDLPSVSRVGGHIESRRRCEVPEDTVERRPTQPVQSERGENSGNIVDSFRTLQINDRKSKKEKKQEKLLQQQVNLITSGPEEKLDNTVKKVAEVAIAEVLINSKSDPVKQVEDVPQAVGGVPMGQHAQFVNPQSPFPQMLNQVHLLNNIYNQRLFLGNPLQMQNNVGLMGGPSRLVSTQNPLDHTSNIGGYSLTATYNQRLHIVDCLFRFIMQILRTPEPPPIQQIEMLKQLLDSMVVPKP